jgi:hypothetical protein
MEILFILVAFCIGGPAVLIGLAYLYYRADKWNEAETYRCHWAPRTRYES